MGPLQPTVCGNATCPRPTRARARAKCGRTSIKCREEMLKTHLLWPCFSGDHSKGAGVTIKSSLTTFLTMYNTRCAVWRFLRRKKRGMRYYANFLVITSPPTFLNSVYPSRHFPHVHKHSHTPKVWQGMHKNTNNDCFWRMGISDSFYSCLYCLQHL